MRRTVCRSIVFHVIVTRSFAFVPSSEIFISDINSNLYSVDTRNGRILCGYRCRPIMCPFCSQVLICYEFVVRPAISGAVNSIAITPTHLASTSLDRFFRLHPAYAPPTVAGSQTQAQHKGETVVKVFMKSTPTAVVWDEEFGSALVEPDDNDRIPGKDAGGSKAGDEEDVWEGMDVVEVDSTSDHEDPRPTSRRRHM